MRKIERRVVVLVVVSVACLVASACQPGPTPVSFTVAHHAVTLPAGQEPNVLVRGFDGALWYSGTNVPSVGRFDPVTQVTTSYPLPAGIGVLGMLAAPDGSVWATTFDPDGSGALVRTTPTAGAVVVTDLGAGAMPFGISYDGLDGFWFTDAGRNLIVRYSYATGVVAEYPVGTGVFPTAVLAGSDGTVYFVPGERAGLGQLDPTTGAVTVSSEPASRFNSLSFSLVAGPAGTLWYSRLNSLKVFRYDIAAGSSTAIDTGAMNVWGLTGGNDGAMWATVYCAAGVGLVRIDPATNEISPFDAGLGPVDGASGLVRDGAAFWFITSINPGLHHAVPAQSSVG
ncbi:MAG: hypothetical protein ABIP03_03255 [Aquihabitans sp.]